MIVLASSSPRRAELLSQIGVEFIKQTADIDETPHKGELPVALVERLARQKAEKVADLRRDSLLVLGSDTIGVIDEKPLLKPESYEHFQSMMTMMSGRRHSVITAIAVAKYCPVHKKLQIKSEIVESKVVFKVLSEQEIENYWRTGEPHDKAGGYAIQGIAGQFVKQIEGSYSAIVGLPLYETTELLKHMSEQLQ